MFSFAFQNLEGLTLNAKLFDSAGTQTGSTITTGFNDLGDGAYQYLATIPDGHVGTLKIYDSAQPSRCIPLSINPAELENADVKTSTRATPANVTSAQTAITDAIDALHDITAADVVTALMSYSVESGKDYATVLKEVYAILRGKYVANAADPTSIEFYAPDGTTVRVTHTLTDTTRTPS